MGTFEWSMLIRSLFDWNGSCNVPLLGQDLNEWLELVRTDYDEVDRLLVDHETIGG